MIIVMKQGSSDSQIDEVVSLIEKLGYKAHLSKGVERTIIGVIGHKDKSPIQSFASLDSVESVIPILKPFKLASMEMKGARSVVDVDGVKIGGSEPITVIAGPCSVESRDQIIRIAHAVKKAGAQILRGGAYKPRTSPYSFQGLEEEGLKFLREAKEETGLKIVTEIVAIGDIDLLVEYADMIQIGARNCQNFALLKAVGQTRKPVLFKRGMSTTIKEFLQAAEYMLSEGNNDVVLCERGVRTFEDSTRNTLDLSAVSLLRKWSHLPVAADPSHGTGVRELVMPMSLAAIAAGADCLTIEVHDRPEEAFSDGPQSLKPDDFADCLARCAKVAEAVGRKM